MSSTSSAASAVSLSDSNELGCELSLSANASHTREQCSQSTGPQCPVTRMSVSSAQLDLLQMESPSMSSAEGSPARTSVSPAMGAGLAGERSGLWREYARLVGELRPRFVIVENVAALLSRGLAEVLGDLASLGFDAEWHCIPASAVGAPHRRDRIWIVAYPKRDDLREQSGRQRWPRGSDSLFAAEYGFTRNVADAAGERRGEARELRCDESTQWISRGGTQVADASSTRLEGRGTPIGISEEIARAVGSGWWGAEPDVGRVAHGVPARAHRLRCLGNAVVPQIPEIIGRAIMRMSI
jgi:DNA (cytosine-5)-methyltransferase 1